ncbi:MAG: hypothetical protein GXO65_05960 [Euryarchaeota archaeon]|nr:hypothetical protein [Euryarchaeota archaeon]
MDERGQITVEAILIFGMLTLIFVGISFPAMLKTYRAGSDTATVMEMKQNLNRIAGGIEFARRGGPGTVRTVTITTTTDTWAVASYPDSWGSDYGQLNYLIKWNSSSDVPDEVQVNNSDIGLLKIDSFQGISSPSSVQVCPPSPYDKGPGSWEIIITNNATSITPTIQIDCSEINQSRIKVVLQ